MNAELQSWFTQGRIVEALCGLGEYFIPGVTYRDTHAYSFVVQELMLWAEAGRSEIASHAFETAVHRLLDQAMLMNALMLTHSYYVVRSYHQEEVFPIQEERIAQYFHKAVVQSSTLLSSNKELRDYVLIVSEDMPMLKSMLGLSSSVGGS